MPRVKSDAVTANGKRLTAKVRADPGTAQLIPVTETMGCKASEKENKWRRPRFRSDAMVDRGSAPRLDGRLEIQLRRAVEAGARKGSDGLVIGLLIAKEVRQRRHKSKA